jgi:hypothetical protein
MEHLISSARKYGVRQLYSEDLADDCSMRELAQEIGMSVRRDPGDARQVIYSLSLLQEGSRAISGDLSATITEMSHPWKI